MSEETDFICCQDCGRIIYYDKDMEEPVTSVDDISAPPYVTESGDLFCCLCGPAYDEPDEEDDFSNCCFCKEKYLSEACRECPAREDPLPDEVEEEE